MSLEISAVICTHNRASYLPRAIASLVDSGIEDDQELLVVDNASTDATCAVVSSFDSVKRLRYVYEPRLGLAHARNAGWRNAAGRYVAYLDDDAIAVPGWLGRIQETFENVRPRPGCVGGKVAPIWEAPRPNWLSDDLIAGLAIVDWSHTPRPLADLRREWLVGANIAFPREILERIDGFTPSLDRVGKHLLSNGDTFMQALIAESGYTCWYDPAIAVSHHIHAGRLSKRWFYRRYYAQGLSDAVVALLRSGSSIRIRARDAYLHLSPLLHSPGKWGILLWPTDDPERFAEKCFTLITLGRIAGMLGRVSP